MTKSRFTEADTEVNRILLIFKKRNSLIGQVSISINPGLLIFINLMKLGDLTIVLNRVYEISYYL